MKKKISKKKMKTTEKIIRKHPIFYFKKQKIAFV